MNESQTLKLLIEGKYNSPSEGSTFEIEYENGGIRAITAGNNSIPLNQKDGRINDMLSEAIIFLRNLSAEGIRIGSTHGDAENDTFELFLRDFSNSGGLGTYISPLLVRLGKAEIFAGQRGAWIRAKN